MTPVPPALNPLTPGARRLLWLALLLSGMVGFGAAQGVAQVSQLERLKSIEPPVSPFADSESMRAAGKAMLAAEISGLEGMRTSRGFILMALSVTAALVFVSAIRMLRPGAIPREGIRQLLGGTAIASAVLRVLDGAQLTAIARRMGAAGDRILRNAPATELPGGYPDGMMEWSLMIVSGLFTLFVVASFFGISVFARSEGLRAQIAKDP